MGKFTLPANTLEILTGVVVLLLLLNLAQLIALRRMSARVRRFTHLLRVADRGSLDELLETYATDLKDIHRKLNDVASWQQKMDVSLAGCARTPVLLRYQAFEGVGGDLSYSCAVLNSRGDGMVFTNLHTQNASYSYGKPMRAGRSDYPLTAEEQEAVSRILKNPE